jgi:hypothetical protein
MVERLPNELTLDDVGRVFYFTNYYRQSPKDKHSRDVDRLMVTAMFTIEGTRDKITLFGDPFTGQPASKYAYGQQCKAVRAFVEGHR